MKKYVILETNADDDGNLSSRIVKIVDSVDEVKVEVKNKHDEVVNYFDSPDDSYDDGDLWFDICEEDDSAIRTVVSYEEVEI